MIIFEPTECHKVTNTMESMAYGISASHEGPVIPTLLSNSFTRPNSGFNSQIQTVAAATPDVSVGK
ncbi:hypothetical protein D3C86_2204630 [compost metagenome]